MAFEERSTHGELEMANVIRDGNLHKELSADDRWEGVTLRSNWKNPQKLRLWGSRSREARLVSVVQTGGEPNSA